MEVQVGAKTGKLLNAKEESQQEEGKQQDEKPEKKKGKKPDAFFYLTKPPRKSLWRCRTKRRSKVRAIG